MPSLTSVDLSCFNTESVRDMSYMFSSCSSLVSIDLSQFNTLNVKNMNYMFADCSKLIYLDISNFETKQDLSCHSFFSKIPSKGNIKLSESIYKEIRKYIPDEWNITGI